MSSGHYARSEDGAPALSADKAKGMPGRSGAGAEATCVVGPARNPWCARHTHDNPTRIGGSVSALSYRETLGTAPRRSGPIYRSVRPAVLSCRRIQTTGARLVVRGVHASLEALFFGVKRGRPVAQDGISIRLQQRGRCFNTPSQPHLALLRTHRL